MKDIEFGDRLKKLRKHRGLKQNDAWEKIGVTYGSLQRHEGGNRPTQNNLKKYLNFYGCDEVWLITGRGGVFSGQVEPYIKKDGEEKFPEIGERGYNQEYGSDPYIRATAGLKEIFDSGDPILIPAIQANIHAFQVSVRREQQIQQQTDEINNLKKENEEVKKRLADLEDKHKPGDPHATASLKESAM